MLYFLKDAVHCFITVPETLVFKTIVLKLLVMVQHITNWCNNSKVYMSYIGAAECG